MARVATRAEQEVHDERRERRDSRYPVEQDQPPQPSPWRSDSSDDYMEPDDLGGGRAASQDRQPREASRERRSRPQRDTRRTSYYQDQRAEAVELRYQFAEPASRRHTRAASLDEGLGRERSRERVSARMDERTGDRSNRPFPLFEQSPSRDTNIVGERTRGNRNVTIEQPRRGTRQNGGREDPPRYFESEQARLEDERQRRRAPRARNMATSSELENHQRMEDMMRVEAMDATIEAAVQAGVEAGLRAGRSTPPPNPGFPNDAANAGHARGVHLSTQEQRPQDLGITTTEVHLHRSAAPPDPGYPDDSHNTNNAQADPLYDSFVRLSLGYKEIPWYNFKRFENISLLSLYAYQHDLLMFDKRTFGDGNLEPDPVALPIEELEQMRKVLKEYHEALLLFKSISQLQRPTRKEIALTNLMLARETKEDHYLKEHDASALLSLGLEALNFDRDKIRSYFKSLLKPSSVPKTNKLLTKESLAYQTTHNPPPGAPPSMRPPKLPGTGQLPPGQKRWILDNPTIDYLLRLLVGLIAGVSLLGPMILLCFVHRKAYIILTACLSVLTFALAVSLVGGGATHEVMVAVATYAAVIVVFVGQTDTPRS